jgi:hypothetical protein
MTYAKYKHQEDLLLAAPSRRLIAFGCGAGKTRAALGIAHQAGGVTLVVAPKTQVLDRTWEKEKAKMGVEMDLVVVSKEQFKKHQPRCDNLIIDESHTVCGVTPATRHRQKQEVPRASQLFEAVAKYVKESRLRTVLLCSATPFPQPMALWAAATLLGEEWDYFAFRRKFYAYVHAIGRGVWLPKKDDETKQLLMILAQKIGTFGRLEDFFDVPDQVFKDVSVGDTVAMRKAMKELPLLYPEPLSRVSKRHQLEQGSWEGKMLDENKVAEIVELAKEFKKLVVFARYTKQLYHIQSTLQSKFPKKQVLILDGQTIDRKWVLDTAEKKDLEVVLVVQSQVSTGYELPSFRCTVFASMSYSFVDYEQALGRTQRANAISKNVYVHLTAGEVDEAVLECVRGKRDFNEALFAQEKV